MTHWHKESELPNIVMTTSTGSGKSLAFLGWLTHMLTENSDLTGLATFPTKALLFGQAERLAVLSDEDSLWYPDDEEDTTAYAGTIRLGQIEIPWSIWIGSKAMHELENDEAFTESRLRLATPDKLNVSLMAKKSQDFLRQLGGFVVDEAHLWQGLGGASIRTMLDRMRLSLDLLQSPHPAFFRFLDATSGILPVPVRRIHP